MIPLMADPKAIAIRMKVGIDPDVFARSVSGELAMILFETKLQDMPKPMPMKVESKAINQSGPFGMA